MKKKIIFWVLVALSVSVAALLGLSEQAGLFGAILSGGSYIIDLIEDESKARGE